MPEPEKRFSTLPHKHLYICTASNRTSKAAFTLIKGLSQFYLHYFLVRFKMTSVKPVSSLPVAIPSMTLGWSLKYLQPWAEVLTINRSSVGPRT